MTSTFPFAGATALCDAASSSPLPELMSATSPVAVIRSSDGAFSPIRHCEFCDAPLPRIKRRCCGSDACLLAMDRAHVVAANLKDAPPAAEGQSEHDPIWRRFTHLSFADSPRASAWEPRFTKLPEPAASLTGSTGQMCAMARPR